MPARRLSDLTPAAAVKRARLQVDGRRVLFSRGRKKVEVAIAVTPAVAQRICACLRALSGLDPRAPRLRRRPAKVRAGEVLRVLLAADELANTVEAMIDRKGRATRRKLCGPLGRFWRARVRFVSAPHLPGEAEAREQPSEPVGRWG